MTRHPRLVALLMLMHAGAAPAQATVDAARALARARSLTAALPDCRPARRTEDTILVCGRKREDPFRIPEIIRAEPQPRKAGAATAWGNLNGQSEDAARTALPGGGGVDGTAGQSGHGLRIHREWEQERQAIAARRADPER